MSRWGKELVSWRIGDTLYVSVVFSWHIDQAVAMLKKHDGLRLVGGPAAVLNPEAFDGVAEVREAC